MDPKMLTRLIRKEALYTRRNLGGALAHVAGPIVVIAGASMTLAREPNLEPLRPFFMYMAVYVAISFTTVHRAVNRVRHDGRERTGTLYLRTRARPVEMVLAKAIVEFAQNCVGVLPPVVALFFLLPGVLNATAIVHIVVAVAALTMTVVALSSLSDNEGGYYAVSLGLTMGPLLLIPNMGFGPQSAAARFLSFIPTFPAFAGLRSIVAGESLNRALIAVLAVETVAYLFVGAKLYERMLVRTLS